MFNMKACASLGKPLLVLILLCYMLTLNSSAVDLLQLAPVSLSSCPCVFTFPSSPRHLFRCQLLYRPFYLSLCLQDLQTISFKPQIKCHNLGKVLNHLSQKILSPLPTPLNLCLLFSKIFIAIWYLLTRLLFIYTSPPRSHQKTCWIYLYSWIKPDT